jgi:hypothetical protein
MSNDPTHDDTEHADDELLDDFASDKTVELAELEAGENAEPGTASTNDDAEADGTKKDAWPVRLNALDDVLIGSRAEPSAGPAALVPSRPGELSPRKIAEAHMMLILLWILRFGWSTREITDHLRGTKGDGATSNLIRRKLLAEFPAANPLAIRAQTYVCLTKAGLQTIREWLEAWEEEIELSYGAAYLPAAYPAWARASLPSSTLRYRCLSGRIRHARAQHDWLLQKWFVQFLLRCEPCDRWSVKTPAGALMPASWGSVTLNSWHFADELESDARRAHTRAQRLPHIPDLELRTPYYAGFGGLKSIEVELENSRKRDDEIDTQVQRSARLFHRAQFIDDACTRHTLIIATSDLLYKHWRDAFNRDEIPRWTVDSFRKRTKDRVPIRLTPPADWRDRTTLGWDGQVHNNIERPASLVRLRHDRNPAAKTEPKPRRPRKPKKVKDRAKEGTGAETTGVDDHDAGVPG